MTATATALFPVFCVTPEIRLPGADWLYRLPACAQLLFSHAGPLRCPRRASLSNRPGGWAGWCWGLVGRAMRCGRDRTPTTSSLATAGLITAVAERVTKASIEAIACRVPGVGRAHYCFALIVWLAGGAFERADNVAVAAAAGRAGGGGPAGSDSDQEEEA